MSPPIFPTRPAWQLPAGTSHLRRPLPAEVTGPRLHQALRHSYRNQVGHLAAVDLLVWHDFWLSRPPVVRHLHLIDVAHVCADSSASQPARPEEVELDFDGIETERRAGRLGMVGEAGDHAVLHTALSLAVGPLGDMLVKLNGINRALLGAALLNFDIVTGAHPALGATGTVAAVVRQARSLLAGIPGRRRDRLDPEPP